MIRKSTIIAALLVAINALITCTLYKSVDDPIVCAILVVIPVLIWLAGYINGLAEHDNKPISPPSIPP